MLLCVKINVHTEEAERRVQAMRRMSRSRTGVYSVVSPVSSLLKKRAFPRTCLTLALYHVFYRFVEPHTCMRIAVPVIRLFLQVIFTNMVRKHKSVLGQKCGIVMKAIRYAYFLALLQRGCERCVKLEAIHRAEAHAAFFLRMFRVIGHI